MKTSLSCILELGISILYIGEFKVPLKTPPETAVWPLATAGNLEVCHTKHVQNLIDIGLNLDQTWWTWNS